MGLEVFITSQCCADCGQRAVVELEDLGFITFSAGGQLGFTEKAKRALDRAMLHHPELFNGEEIVVAMDRLFD